MICTELVVHNGLVSISPQLPGATALVTPRRPATAGCLLVASPLLTEETFAGTVIALLEHDDSNGSLGVVLNRPLDVDVADVLPGWDLVVGGQQVFQGGPVGLDSALALGVPRVGVTHSTVLKAVGNSWGLVDLDSDTDDVARDMHEVRVFAGYAGWSAGQLQAELAEGAWYVVDVAADPRIDLCSVNPERLWTQVMRRQSSDLRFLLHWVQDCEQN